MINYDLLYYYDLVFEIAHYIIATLFCIEIVDLKGKSLGDKLKMMAEHWPNLSAEDKAKYMSSVGSDSEDSDEELSAADKKRVAIRVAFFFWCYPL